MANSTRILITGATGAVGPLVLKAFHDARYSIRTLSIDPPPVGIWPDDVEGRIGDVTDAVSVKEAMEGVEAVVHLAALLHIVNPPPTLKEKYERINVGGTATIVDAAIQAGVRRVVLFSTIAVYGQAGGQILTEATSPHPDTFYAHTKLAAEKIVLNARGADGQPLGTVLRLGAVYGSRIKGNYDRLTRALAGNRFIPVGSNLGTRSQFLAKLGHVPRLPFIPVGNGLNRRTLVYDKDVGRAAVLAVSHPAAAGRIFNVTDGEFHTLNEIIESICYALSRKPPRLSLPLGPTRTFIGLIEKGSHVMGLKPPITKAVIDKYTEDIAVDGSLIKKELGFLPQYDLITGWEETIREMRETILDS